MERMQFDRYKSEIEVIKSMPHVPAMHDELRIFVELHKPEDFTLMMLREALEAIHPVSQAYDAQALEYKHEPVFTFETDDIPQIISDLINFELDEIEQKQLKNNRAAIKLFRSLRFDFQASNTFSSDLSTQEISRIGALLVENNFIQIKSENDFVYAFSEQPIEKNRKIKWLDTYNGGTRYIYLAWLVNHIASDESSKYFEELTNKVHALFDFPCGKPHDTTGFYNSLLKIRTNKYPGSQTANLFSSILYPL